MNPNPNSSKKRKNVATSPNPILSPILTSFVPPPFQLSSTTTTTQTDERVPPEHPPRDVEGAYSDTDIDYLRKLKKKSIILYQRFTDTKDHLFRRDITLQDILGSELTMERRTNLLELYEALQQIAPYTEEYVTVRNRLRALFHRYTATVGRIEDPDVENFSQRLRMLTIHDSANANANRTVLEEKLEEFKDLEKGEERSKLKRWMTLATSLPFDRLLVSQADHDLLQIKRYMDANLFGMENVKERLLVFLHKKRLSATRGCNIGLIGTPGVGKCLHPDTPVRMADTSIRLAKEIQTGDYLLGTDSFPRLVTSTITGTDTMYSISQEFGESYMVNEAHILTLLRLSDTRIVDMPITGVIGYEHLYEPVNGFYQGNVHNEQEAIVYGKLYASHPDSVVCSLPAYYPRLPPNYMQWTLNTKLAFYRSFTKASMNVYMHPTLPINDILLLLRSTGVRCKIEEDQYIRFPTTTEYFRITKWGRGNYCGFTITGNRRFVLGDWTATHNTAIAKTLSTCLNVPFSQISFGGVTHSDFLLGHDYTYIGSRPGEITRCLARMGAKNGILFFDEFDKAKEVLPTLLHVTDFSQNHEFRDNYFPELTQDLSRIWFIYSMNEVPTDPAMLDRLEIIHVDGYTNDEKRHIAKNYLIPKFAKDLNIEGKCVIDDQALTYLVNSSSPGEAHTKSGVRSLERSINLVMEHVYFFMFHRAEDYPYDWFKQLKRVNPNTEESVIRVTMSCV